jgi:hypothetical protein
VTQRLEGREVDGHELGADRYVEEICTGKWIRYSEYEMSPDR